MGRGEREVRETYEALKKYDDRINYDPVGERHVSPRLPSFVATLADHLGEDYEVDEGHVDRDDRRTGRRLAITYLDGGDLPPFAAAAKEEIEVLRRKYVENPNHCPYCGGELVGDYCQSHDCPCPTFPEALDGGTGTGTDETEPTSDE